eukprot:scaffold14367_cov250-Ochromonas_danica.AAC.12
MISCSKRLHKEAIAVASQADENILLLKPKEDIFQWEATIKGPKDSYYDGYLFDLAISVPSEYPMIPPTIRFKTKIFHPNIMFQTGEICLDILKKNWSPAWSLQSACRAIVALLGDPAPDRSVHVICCEEVIYGPIER